MKLRKTSVLLILIALPLLSSGCVKFYNLPETLNPEALPTLPVSSVESPSLLSTTSPIPSPTLDIIPPLSMDEARVDMLSMLINNGGCRLPCLWGITPGKSLLQESRAILAPFVSLSTLNYLNLNESGGVNLRYTEIDMEIAVSVGFLIDPSNKRVSRIVLNANAQKETKDGFEDVFNSNFYNEHMSYYMLPNILSEYGRPTDVLLLTSADIPPQQSWWPFEIIVSYPEEGILIHYKTPMLINGAKSIGCPKNSQILLELRPAKNIKSTQEFLESYNYPYFELFRPIDEVTSLSVDDFFEIFSQSTDKCIETPSNYWPPSY